MLRCWVSFFVRGRYETLIHSKKVAPYLGIFVFSIPDVGAGSHAVISVVASWLMYPLPAQIFPEVDVKVSHAAGLCLAA